MNSQYTIKFFGYLTVDYQAAQRDLEDRAREGYELIKMYSNCPFAKFKRIDPRPIKYHVEVVVEETEQERREAYEALGFECIEGNYRLLVAKAVEELPHQAADTDVKLDADVELDTDVVLDIEAEKYIKMQLSTEMELQEAIRKHFFQDTLPMLILVPLFLMQAFDTLGEWDYRDMLSNLRIIMPYLQLAFVAFILIYSVYIISVMYQAKKACRQGIPVRIPHTKRARVRGKIYYSFPVVCVLMMIGAMCDQIIQMPQILLLIVGPIVLGITLANYVGKKKQQVARGEALKMKSSVIVVIIVATLIAFFTMMYGGLLAIMSGSRGTEDPTTIQEIREDVQNYPILSFTDFEAYQDKPIEYVNFDSSHSLFVPTYYDYIEHLRGEGILRTEYYEAMSLDVAQKLMTGIREEAERWELEPIGPKYFDADEALYSAEGGMLLLRKGCKVVWLDTPFDYFDPTTQDVIQKIMD